MAWQLQAAKQRFSELVERAQREGPQVVTKHGRDAVVVSDYQETKNMEDVPPILPNTRVFQTTFTVR